ncbi:amidase domain-containing protein [Paraclostridium sordellii]|uniref:amidase domain-containing protein n=1 Tax=Paraclostridium sordellii TaxID=1505 RepID=UPI0022E0A70E|nr:amidase domain-containing protein [Paeniclostridium sordellii]
MIKKFLKSTFVFIVMFFLTLTSVNAQTLENNDLKDVLTKYFSHSFDVRKTLENTKNQYVLPGSLLQQEDNLNSQFISTYGNQLGEQISDYNLDLDMTVISQDTDSIKVNVVTKVNFNYVDSEDPSYSEENHIVYLKKSNDTILVEKDIFDQDKDLTVLDNSLSSNETYTTYMNEKFKNLENKMNNVNKMLDIETQPKKSSRSKRSAKRYSGYNGSTGAAWAKKYAHPKRDSENKYGSVDCTNFASWTLFRGGMPTDKVWYHYSNAWIRVIELRNWLLNKGYATEKDRYQYASLGDIIQYKSKSGVWKHSVVVTSKTSKYPYVRVSAHSKNRSDVNVSGLYYPNGEFVSYRVLCIH